MVVSVEVQTKIPIFGWTIVCNRMQRTVFREVNGRFGVWKMPCCEFSDHGEATGIGVVHWRIPSENPNYLGFDDSRLRQLTNLGGCVLKEVFHRTVKF